MRSGGEILGRVVIRSFFEEGIKLRREGESYVKICDSILGIGNGRD